QCVAVETGLDIHFDAAVLEDLRGGGRELVSDEDFGCHWFFPTSSRTRRSREPGPLNGNSLHAVPGLALRAHPGRRSSGFGKRRLRLREGPVEPWEQRLEVGRLDRRARPQADVRRRVAMAGGIVAG